MLHASIFASLTATIQHGGIPKPASPDMEPPPLMTIHSLDVTAALSAPPLAGAQVVDYKGVTGSRKFVPFSEYNMFRFGNGHSAYFNADILQNLRRHLDLGLETSLGYFYTDIFRRHASWSMTSRTRLPARGVHVHVGLSAYG